MTAPGGITDASNNASAGSLAGSSSVVAPFTEVAGPTGHVDWTPATDISSASNIFDDPEAGKGQPPLCPPGGSCSTDYSHTIRVPGGNPSSVCSTACPPGVYYATTAGGTTPTGNQLTIPDGTVFENTTGATSGFGNYVFVGGASVGGTVTMAAGRYVMVGTNSAGTDTLDVSGGTVIGGTSATSDAGRIIILTDSAYQAYAGDTNMSTILAGLPPGLPALSFGPTEFKSGKRHHLVFYGLDPGSSSLPSELQNFAPVVIWQDQQNLGGQVQHLRLSGRQRRSQLHADCWREYTGKRDDDVLGRRQQHAWSLWGSSISRVAPIFTFIPPIPLRATLS